MTMLPLLIGAERMSNRQTNFGTVERTALPEQIVERILEMIKQGELKAGDRLPAERDLAVKMNVGRPAIREALRALSMMNVIEIRQGAGAYVTALETAQLIRHLDFVFALDVSAILDLFAARKVVEVGIIELAAQHITDEEIAEVEENLRKSMAALPDPEEFLKVDLELHALIARIARNPILTRFMESIHQLSWASRRRTGRMPGVQEQSLADHTRIVEALKTRSPEKAREAMLAHLENVESRMKQLASEPDAD
jgi:GntR family transcriptional regulator, transcriptional repressor for pyruvate dehydrogenase complex